MTDGYCWKRQCLPVWKGTIFLSVLESFFNWGGHMKPIIRLLCVSLVLTALFACAPNAQEEIIIDFDVSLTVLGLSERVLTQDDFNKMPFVEETITRIGRDGTEFVYQVKGILLKDVLAYLDVTPSVVKLEAIDGYSQEYNSDIFNDSLTILAFFNDGEPLLEEDGPIWMFAGNFTGNFWVRKLINMTLE